MLRFTIPVLLLHFTGILTKDHSVSYNNYRVYEVIQQGYRKPKIKIPGHGEPLEALRELHQTDSDGNINSIRSYLIPKWKEFAFIKVLKAIGANFSVSTNDLGEAIRNEKNNIFSATTSESYYYEYYHSYPEMLQYLYRLSYLKNPINGQFLAEVEYIGKSYEGRDMHLVKISSDHSAQKPIIFFEAGIHGREWSASASAYYMIYQLVENFTFNYQILDNIDFYIIPLSNPDGYEFSRTNDRMWRKTRSVYRGIYGTDGNRNFDFHWGERGTSDNPDSDIFRGPFPFSESETRNIRDAALKYRNRIRAFIAVHAYGPYIIFPWSYARTAPPPDHERTERVAHEAAEAIKQFSGTNFTTGMSSLIMYEASGGADDYFKGGLGIDLSFTVELSSAGLMSFIVPETKLVEVESEVFEGFKVIARNAVAIEKKRSTFRKSKGNKLNKLNCKSRSVKKYYLKNQKL